jgi:hut operon positive regulator
VFTLDSIGQVAVLTALGEEEVRKSLALKARANGYIVCLGRVGSMDSQKVVAAIETAAVREGLTRPEYPEEHALYHAIIEALQGVLRGNMVLSGLHRTVGLRFSVVRGPRSVSVSSHGEWVAVGLYGTIGAPLKGNEHEVVGLGMSHL